MPVAPTARARNADLDQHSTVEDRARIAGATLRRSRVHESARVYGPTTLTNTTLGGTVTITGECTITGVTITAPIHITNGATITSPDDLIILDFPFDPFTWAAHRTTDGWVANAGCVHAVPFPFHINLRDRRYGGGQLAEDRTLIALPALRQAVLNHDPTLTLPTLTGPGNYHEPTWINNGARPGRA